MELLLDRPASVVTELGLAAALPRLDPAVAHALSHVYSHGAAMDLPLAGTVHQLVWAEPVGAPAPVETFRFELGDGTGTLSVDRVTVAALLGEARSERLPRELRCVLWADALHAVGRALESATRQRLVWLPDGLAAALEPDPGRTAWFSLSGPSGSGRGRGFVQLDSAPALAALLSRWPRGAASPRHTVDTLRWPLSFVLGSAQIPIAELRGVRRGDIVGIGDWGSAGAAVRVNASPGGPRGIRLDGTAEGTRITIHHTKDLTMHREPASTSGFPDEPPAGAELPLDRLDHLEVNLRFEVGDLSISLAELRAIQPGHVFDLPHTLSRSPVRILAHGNVLGQGHLVAVGDRLGVRVSDFAPSEV